MAWRKFFNDKEDEEFIPPIFKSKKYNFPKNHNTPTGFKTYLVAGKSEINDPRNRYKASCNIPKEQLVALKELIKLQRDRKTIIKRCDKVSGIIILNFEDYVNATYAHLNSTLTNIDGSTRKYYTKVDEPTIKTAKTKLKRVLEEALDNNLITQTEFSHMIPDGKNVHDFQSPQGARSWKSSSGAANMQRMWIHA